MTSELLRINEARRALALVQSNLHDAYARLQAARCINDSYALGLDLPAEKVLLDAMNATAAAFQGMKLPERQL